MGITVVVLFGIFAAISAALPKEYYVERTIVINADNKIVHDHIGDLKKWDAWTPWKTVDPNMVVVLGEKTVGVGASQTWEDQTGGGSLEFIATDPETGIAYDLYFADFPKVDAAMELYALPDGSTKVVWWMSGVVPTPIIGGMLAAVMDASVGPLFELGLENLKQVIEQPSS